jgi:hypothetical protein
MARKPKRSRAAASRKPTASDELEVGLRAELRRQQRPAFKARLAAAERDPKWQKFKEQFERIAAAEQDPKWQKLKKQFERIARSKRSRFIAAVKQNKRYQHWIEQFRLVKEARRWSGRKKDFLFTIAFPNHPKGDEDVWAPSCPNDYSRSITRIAWERYGLLISPWTVKRAYDLWKKPKK